MKLVTWNLDGSSTDGENIYPTVEKLLKNGADILCLQECGTLPVAAEVLNATQKGRVFRWAPGPNLRPLGPYFIYYYDYWDKNNNRVHLGVVWKASHTKDFDGSDLSIIKKVDNTIRDGRPVIGVTIGGTTIYSIHAMAGHGNDGPPLLEQVAQAEGGNNWLVAGDYNRVPGSLEKKFDEKGLNATIWEPNGPTKAPSKNAQPAKTYDYAVTNMGGSNEGTVGSSEGKSDHWPVAYEW